MSLDTAAGAPREAGNAPGRGARAGKLLGCPMLIPLFRAAVGPLAFVAFFLPWAHGPGPLAGEAYSGFDLVGLAGRLQALQLTAVEGGTLWVARLAILAVAVAAAWQTALAPADRWHLAYRASGWYLAGFAAAAVALGLARSGLTTPPPGLALLAAAGMLWLLASWWSRRDLAGMRAMREG